MGNKPHIISFIFGTLAFLGMLYTPWLVLVETSIEAQMVLAQKIFYYHVPSAMMMYLGFFICFVFSVLYLWKRSRRFDIYASCGAEVGLLFCVLVMLSGPLWAKPIWNGWWVWDAQLTLVVVMFLVYVSYMMLKNYSEESIQGSRFRAVLAIVGFANAPLIHYAVQIWRTHHPAVMREGGGGLPPDMEFALRMCMFVWLCLFIAIFSRRVSIERAREELTYLRAEMRDRKAILGQMAE